MNHTLHHIKNDTFYGRPNEVYGPSTYNVHTEGVRLRWTPADGGREIGAKWTFTQKIF